MNPTISIVLITTPTHGGSMGFTGYSMGIKGTSKAHRLSVKQQIVRYAQEHGVKPSVRKFSVSRNSIKDWLKRYENEGINGLLDKRKGPINIPHKTSESIEQQVIAIRKRDPVTDQKESNTSSIHLVDTAQFNVLSNKTA